MTRGRWAAAILAAWLLSLGWLFKREFFQSTAARLAEAALAVPPGATFYRLDVGGQQVGFASSTIDTLADSIRVQDLLILEVPSLGRLQHTRAHSAAVVSRALRLRWVAASFEGDAGRFAARAEVVGDSVLRLTLYTATDSQTTRIPLERPIVVPTLLPLRLAFGGELRPGRTYSARVFDPFLVAERDVEITVAAETVLVVADSADYDSTAMAWVPVLFDTVRAFRIEQRVHGVTTSAWIDGQGRIVRTATPAGFTAERSAFEIAYENFRRRDTARVVRAAAAGPADIVARTALAAGAALDADAAVELRVRLTGADPTRLALAGGRQQLVGDTLVVRREAVDRIAQPFVLPLRDAALAEHLAPEPLIESADPRIVAQARQILGRERNPRRAAERLLRWVHDGLRREAAVSVPSALEVLARRRGDCNEHTVLYVALARAAGLPARAAAGLVRLGGRFYYHAWPEVWLGEWVAVDPTLGQFPADAAHLRLATGALARQVELLRLVGKLTLEVL